MSLAQSQHQLATLVGHTMKIPNGNLTPLGTPKMFDWDPASREERSTAKKALLMYRKKIAEEFPSKSEDEKDRMLMAQRYAHFEIYQAMMADLPLLQYIRSETPDKAEILSAVSELEKNLTKEEQMVQGLSDALQKTPLPPEVLDFFNYSSLAEEILLENPQYCGLATSLSHTRTNRQIGNALAISLPIMAISFFAPPAAVALGSSAAVGTGIAIGSGVAAGGVFAYESQVDLEQERVRAFSHLYGEKDQSGRTDLSQLEQARLAEKTRNFQLLTLPMAFGGLGAFRSVAIRAGTAASQLKVLGRAALTDH